MAQNAEGWGLFDPGNVGSYPGRVEKVRPGDLGVEIMDMRATDDRGAQLLTITLSRQDAPEVSLFPAFKAPTARIEWGAGAGRDFVDVDFLHGQAITVTASFLRITASYFLGSNVNPSPQPPGAIDSEIFGETDPEDPGSVLLLGASVTQGPHPQAAFGATPRLTTFLTVPPTDVAPGLSPLVPVPNHAQSVTVLGTFAAGILQIDALSTPVPGAILYNQPVLPNLDQLAFPIARGVEFVQLENAGAEPQAPLLLWTIGL